MNKNNWLSDYQKNITSQNGEDGIIEKIFEIIRIDNKYCVDIGASDGKYLSNTWNLITNKTWKGLLIEGDLKRYNKLCDNYKKYPTTICLHKLVTFEEQDIDNILSKSEIPNNFDLLSIDIDGNDYHLWDSIKNYKPRVIIIEFNPTIYNDIEFIQPSDMNIYQGSSILSLVKLGKLKGYELVASTACNAIFVHSELFSLFNIDNNSPEELNIFNKKWESRIFHLYDGTIVLTGNKKFPWRHLTIKQEDIQPLDPKDRIYKGSIKWTPDKN